MNIQELEDKHAQIVGQSELTYPDYIDNYTPDELNKLYHKEEDSVAKEATKLSVEFAISILESLEIGKCYECDADNEVSKKVQELKQYLNEE